MSNLIEEGGDLVSELQGGAGEIEMGKQHQEAEDYSDRHWMPDPLDAPPGESLSSLSLTGTQFNFGL